MHICAKQYTFFIRGLRGCANRAISRVMYGRQECDPLSHGMAHGMLCWMMKEYKHVIHTKKEPIAIEKTGSGISLEINVL